MKEIRLRTDRHQARCVQTAYDSGTTTLTRRRPGVWQRFARHRVAAVGARDMIDVDGGPQSDAPVLRPNDRSREKSERTARDPGPQNHPSGSRTRRDASVQSAGSTPGRLTLGRGGGRWRSTS